jgi:hypothetical protein
MLRPPQPPAEPAIACSPVTLTIFENDHCFPDDRGICAWPRTHEMSVAGDKENSLIFATASATENAEFVSQDWQQSAREPYIDGLRAHPVNLASHRDLHCSAIALQRCDLPEAGRKVERGIKPVSSSARRRARKALNSRRF